MPVRISQVAARLNRLIGPYRARSRSRASKLLARPPRSRNSVRMPVNTHLVILTGSALGTTRVMIADSRVATTIPAPTPKASTASTVVPTASSLPSPPTRRGGGPPPGSWPPPWPGLSAPRPGSRPSPPGAPAGPAAAPTAPAAPGRASPLEGMPASARTARTVEASSGVRKFPSRRLGAPGGRLPDPSSIPGSSHPPAWVGVQGCLQCSPPRQPAWEIGRHRLVWSMAPAC